MFKLNHGVISFIFLLVAGGCFYLYKTSDVKIEKTEKQLYELQLQLDSIKSTNIFLLDSISIQNNNIIVIKYENDSLTKEIEKSYKRIYDTTVSQNDSVTYWYVSYITFSEKHSGFEGVKTKRAFFDPCEIRKEIKVENKIGSDEIIHILYTKQMSEAAYKNYIYYEPYNK